MGEQYGTRIEIAVVGAGITGLSIAWQLAQRGAGSIAIFDGGGIGSGASSIQPGGVRQQWGTPLACRMARESYGFYQAFDARLEPAVSPGLTACGYVFVAESQAQLDELTRLVAVQRSMGVPSQVISPDEAVELVPGLAPSGIVGASTCAEDAYFDRPLAVVAGFADACTRSGVSIVQTNVAAIERDGAGWRLELADGTRALAGQVVVAAGYDSAALLAPLAIELPIISEAKYLFYSNPIRERLLEPLVVSQERHFAAKQLADGSVLASDLAATGDPATDRSAWHRRVREAISAILPILEYVEFPVLVEGFYDVTPDRQPILGALDGADGLWIAAGLNGRGLMMAPAVGRMLSEVVTGGEPDAILTSFSAGRFARGELIPESQTV